MSIDAASLRKLASLNLAPEQMAGVLGILADLMSAEESRRAGQRERVRKHRAKAPECNVTETFPKRDETVTPPRNGPLLSPAPLSSPLNPPNLASLDQIETRDDKPALPTKPRKTATRLPAGWEPDDEMRQYALAAGLTSAEIRTETERIRDWSASSPKGAKLDWPAAWRNWIKGRLESTPRGQNGGHRQNPSAGQRFSGQRGSSDPGPDAEPFSRNVRVAALAQFRQERLARERQASEPESPDFFGRPVEDGPRGGPPVSRFAAGFDG